MKVGFYPTRYSEDYCGFLCGLFFIGGIASGIVGFVSSSWTWPCVWISSLAFFFFLRWPFDYMAAFSQLHEDDFCKVIVDAFETKKTESVDTIFGANPINVDVVKRLLSQVTNDYIGSATNVTYAFYQIDNSKLHVLFACSFKESGCIDKRYSFLVKPATVNSGRDTGLEIVYRARDLMNHVLFSNYGEEECHAMKSLMENNVKQASRKKHRDTLRSLLSEKRQNGND